MVGQVALQQVLAGLDRLSLMVAQRDLPGVRLELAQLMEVPAAVLQVALALHSQEVAAGVRQPLRPPQPQPPLEAQSP
jgi:hypothetical protein